MVGPGPDDFDALSEETSFRPAGRASITGGAATYNTFFCAKCGRNTQLGVEKFGKLLRGLHERGITTVDMSKLPY